MDNPFVERQESRPDATNFKMPKKDKIFFKKIIKNNLLPFLLQNTYLLTFRQGEFRLLRVQGVAGGGGQRIGRLISLQIIR